VSLFHSLCGGSPEGDFPESDMAFFGRGFLRSCGVPLSPFSLILNSWTLSFFFEIPCLK